MMRSLRAAAVQMVSSTDPETNIATIKRLVREAAEQGADWVLLPEYWPLMGKNDTDKLAFAEPLDDGRVGKTCHTRFQTALSETARECGVVLFGGTVPLQSPNAGKVMNTMLVYDRDGNRVGLYHKMHLFGFSGLGGTLRRSRYDTGRKQCAEVKRGRCSAGGRRLLRFALS